MKNTHISLDESEKIAYNLKHNPSVKRHKVNGKTYTMACRDHFFIVGECSGNKIINTMIMTEDTFIHLFMTGHELDISHPDQKKLYRDVKYQYFIPWLVDDEDTIILV